VVQPFIDERADQDQREALLYILSGDDQPVGTVFQIISGIAETIGDPIFAKIDFEWDLKERRAQVEISNVVRAYSEPTRNPVTGKEHRLITTHPNGWIFREEENLSGFARIARAKVRSWLVLHSRPRKRRKSVFGASFPSPLAPAGVG